MSDQDTNKLALADAYKEAFSGIAGEMVLNDLMTNHHILGSTFHKDNVNATLYNEGQRSVVLRIMGVLNIDTNVLKERVAKNAKSKKTKHV